jgi:hypothetical protein
VKRGHPLVGTTPRTLAPQVATLRQGAFDCYGCGPDFSASSTWMTAAREGGRSTGGDRLAEISLKRPQYMRPGQRFFAGSGAEAARLPGPFGQLGTHQPHHRHPTHQRFSRPTQAFRAPPAPRGLRQSLTEHTAWQHRVAGGFDQPSREACHPPLWGLLWSVASGKVHLSFAVALRKPFARWH